MRVYAKGRPDSDDETILKNFSEQIKTKLVQLKNGESFTEIQVKGNADYKIYNGVPLKPRAGKKCTQCGKCAALCPTNAISPENPRMTDESKCMSSKCEKNKSTEIISIYSGFQGKMRNKKRTGTIYIIRQQR